MYVCTPCVCSRSMEVERGIRPSGTGIMDSSVSPCGCWARHPADALKEHSVLFNLWAFSPASMLKLDGVNNLNILVEKARIQMINKSLYLMAQFNYTLKFTSWETLSWKTKQKKLHLNRMTWILQYTRCGHLILKIIIASQTFIFPDFSIWSTHSQCLGDPHLWVISSLTMCA